MIDKEQEFQAGNIPSAGTYKCTLCGIEVTLNDGEILETCACGCEIYTKIA